MTIDSVERLRADDVKQHEEAIEWRKNKRGVAQERPVCLQVRSAIKALDKRSTQILKKPSLGFCWKFQIAKPYKQDAGSSSGCEKNQEETKSLRINITTMTG